MSLNAADNQDGKKLLPEPEQPEEPIFIKRRDRGERREKTAAGQAHYEKVRAGISFPDKYV